MNATVALGESVNFTCTATAQPLPMISWWRVDNINGTRTQITTTISSYNVTEVVIEENIVVSTLTILEAELSDAGEYVCIAELLPLFSSVEESAILTTGEVVVLCVHAHGKKSFVNNYGFGSNLCIEIVWKITEQSLQNLLS